MHRLAGLALCLWVLGQAAPGAAQDVPQTPGETPGEAPAAEPLEGELGETPAPGEGLETAVSGLAYRLGPGDVLTVNIWGPQPITHQLPVTLEGKVLIPYVGEVEVNRLLLDEAKARIREKILGNYRNVEVSITLVRLRKFQIHVLGQVRAPGAYIATAVDRVSMAVRRAGGFERGASRRRILVENSDTLRTTADLHAFLQGGTGEANPFLSDGDRVVVPFAKDFVRVLGDVNIPGQVQVLEGDKLSDLLSLVGGFSASAFLDTLEFVRYAPGAVDPFRFFVVNGGALLPARPQDAAGIPEAQGRFTPASPEVPFEAAPSYPDFLLQPNDLLIVRRIPELQHRRLVDIQGEVEFPGSYPIEEGITRLSDLVAMAGGLTPDAFLSEARLIRRGDLDLEDPEFERLKRVPVADMQEDEYGYYKMKSRQVPGQMVVDFEKALLGGSGSDDAILQRGDLVVIPTRKDFVSLLGLVARPGNVQYRPGLSAKDYIKDVGGFAEDADKGDSRVIRARSGEWMKLGEAGDLEPGDVVFVPEKEDFEFWRFFRDTMTVIAQLATVYLVVDTATN